MHYRVITTTKDNTLVIQKPHFETLVGAVAYIDLMEDIILAHENPQIIIDLDERIYPLWRANKK